MDVSVDVSVVHHADVSREGWQRDNDRGLLLADSGDWHTALEAFAACADGLARTRQTDAEPDAPLSLVLSNLAQACHRTGRIPEAIEHQERCAALRVALTGNSSMPVARARMDLAVMLAAAGRLDEAWTLIQRVIVLVEHRVGAHDPRLRPVLENAVRIAMASGHVADAEPLRLRLHALVDKAEPSASQEPSRELPQEPPPEAVAEANVLLRTTPSGVPIIVDLPYIEPPSVELLETPSYTTGEPQVTDVEEMVCAPEPKVEPAPEPEPAPELAVESDVTAKPVVAEESTPPAAALFGPARATRPPRPRRPAPPRKRQRDTSGLLVAGAAVALGGAAAAFFLLR